MALVLVLGQVLAIKHEDSGVCVYKSHCIKDIGLLILLVFVEVSLLMSPEFLIRVPFLYTQVHIMSLANSRNQIYNFLVLLYYNLHGLQIVPVLTQIPVS